MSRASLSHSAALKGLILRSSYIQLLWEAREDDGVSLQKNVHAQSHLTLGPRGLQPTGSSVHGILQARHWSGSPCPCPGDLPNPGIKSASAFDRFFTAEPPGKPLGRVEKGFSRDDD